MTSVCRSFALWSAVAAGLEFNAALADQDLGFRGEVGSFTNDFFGDGHDRWRTGSYQRSYYSERRQFDWADGVEVRTRAEIVTPWTPSMQPEGDLSYTTALGLGILGHNRVLGFETRLGGEIILLGDGTGLEAVQSIFHDGLGLDDSFDPSRDDLNRTENGVSLRFETEAARSFRLSEQLMFRPYLEGAAGADVTAGLGVDLVLGPLVSANMWTRDVVTGRLLTPQTGQNRGASLVGGWDIRSVERLMYFPSDSMVELEPRQQRARIGIQFGSEYANFFFGQAWLSPSFVGQTEAQRLGMMSVSFDF